MNRIDDDHKIAAIKVRRHVKARRAQVEHFNLWTALILTAKCLHREGSEAIVAEKDIPQPDDRYSALFRGDHVVHWTFTSAISFPVASRV